MFHINIREPFPYHKHKEDEIIKIGFTNGVGPNRFELLKSAI